MVTLSRLAQGFDTLCGLLLIQPKPIPAMGMLYGPAEGRRRAAT
jgi:hypothetical protein